MLLAQGHEAKSIASTLDLSVHTVNERLRAARRKLGVSSSREAARLLLAQEEAGAETSENIGYKRIGVAPARPGDAYSPRAQLGATGAQRRLFWIMIGATMLAILMSMLVTTHSGGNYSTARINAPEPIGSIPSLFTVSDYPAEAIPHRAQGITDYRLRVNAAGRVEKCEIERSSGSTALDAATCRVITKRARFRPAVDGSGRPVAAPYLGMVHWRY
jgi:TonB family protein